MKILKVKIEVTHENGGTQYIGYPKIWLDNTNKIPEILYPKDRTDEVDENGKTYQIVYPVLPDDLYEKMKDLPICSEPNLTEFTIYSDKHAPSVEVINNQQKVISILAKVGRKQILTKQEENALDPDNQEIGINKTEKWTDKIQKYGITNI